MMGYSDGCEIALSEMNARQRDAGDRKNSNARGESSSRLACRGQGGSGGEIHGGRVA